MRNLSILLLWSLLSNNYVTYANTHQHVLKHERPNQNTIQLVIKNFHQKKMVLIEYGLISLLFPQTSNYF